MRGGLLAVALGILAAVPAGGADRAVTIGLFLPSGGPDAPAGEEVRRGARIAAEAANRDGGIGGAPVRLAVASSDGSWNGASRALVRLIYDEGAVAVAGALDGRSAHVAEQVIARARGEAIFVSCWASEETLTQVRIPWFFRIVPDDRRQGAALAGEIFIARGIARAAAWVEDSFDARGAAESFLRAAPPGRVVLHREGPSPGAVADLVARAGRGEYGAVVLFGEPRAAAETASRLRRDGFKGILAGPLRLARDEFLERAGGTDGALLVAPAIGGTGAAAEFARIYRTAWGRDPEPPALYGHDTVAVLVEALRAAGPSPSRLRAGDRLASFLDRVRSRGVTGPVRFDGRRDRDQSPPLAVVETGRLIPLTERTALREVSR